MSPIPSLPQGRVTQSPWPPPAAPHQPQDLRAWVHSPKRCSLPPHSSRLLPIQASARVLPHQRPWGTHSPALSEAHFWVSQLRGAGGIHRLLNTLWCTGQPASHQRSLQDRQGWGGGGAELRATNTCLSPEQCARTVCLSVLITVGDEDKRALVTLPNTEFQTGSYLPQPCPRPFHRRLKHHRVPGFSLHS